MKRRRRGSALNDFLDTLASQKAGELIAAYLILPFFFIVIYPGQVSRTHPPTIILLLTNFEGANCHQAKFNDARVTLAKSNDAMLIHANFRGALLQGVQFQRADLTGAIFQNAILKHCDLSGAELTGVYFTPKQKNSITKV